MESGTNSIPNLLCNEDISSSLNATALIDEHDENLGFSCVTESDCEFVEMCFEKETINFGPKSDDREIMGLRNARLEIVKWILEKRALFEYHYRTAYLSIIYFDLYVGKPWISEINLWTLRMLSIACLSLAAKMEERRVRSFHEYKVDGYSYQGVVIQRMELCVLAALSWNMSIVTPFVYLNYFVTKFRIESRQQEIVTQAADVILEILEEINTAEYRPSIVAASAVLVVYDHHLEKTILEGKIDAIQSWGSLEKEQTFECYTLLQEILLLRTPKSDIIPSSITAGDSTDTSRGVSKRRLDFDGDEQHCPARKAARDHNEEDDADI